MTGRLVIFLFLAGAPIAVSQERFETGELKGFTKSPTEHIIDRLAEPLTIRNLEGQVRSKELDKPLAKALVEIRGPGQTERIRSAVTSGEGRFRFSGVPDGEYTIKVTLNGFRSVVGAVTVRRSAKNTKLLKIQLLHGV